MEITNILQLIASLGIGAILGAYIQYRLDKRKEIYLKLNQINEDKYKSLLIYMSLVLKPSNYEHFILNDEHIKKLSTDKIALYCLDKLNEYYYHSILYASDEVLQSLKKFIEKPNRDNYTITAKNMRIDLWNKTTKLTEEEFRLEN